MEVKIGKPKPGYQGIWKDFEDSHTATFHGYGLGLVDWEIKSPTDEHKEASSKVLMDLYEKIRLMTGETIFKSYGVYNYDRFFDRYAIKAVLSLFKGYEKLGTLYCEDIMEYLKFFHREEYQYFFGAGEFPFIEYGYIHKEDGEKYIVYFLSR